MALPAEARDYVGELIGYYSSEAASYGSVAASCTGSASEDAAIGMMAGCVYAASLQFLRDRGISPGLDDIDEIVSLVRARADEMRRAASAKRAG